ncbi:glycosyltransferase [Pelagibacteraceae bacterium]|nr:glycosyltransferase [Pelagibacteraceae bacterium]
MEKLFIISNESIFNYEESFFCDNIDLKSTPEGLNNKFEVNLIGRKSKKIRSHKIDIKNIKTYRNILSYLLGIIRSLKEKNTKYLIISISPFTFIACVLIKLFKKKPVIYLRSDGYGEYNAIFGFFGKIIYHLMFSTASKISSLISCRKYILKNKVGYIVAPSQITDQWLKDHKEAEIQNIKLLYVGRIKKEKGIYSLLEIIKDSDISFSLSIVGAEKNSANLIVQDNVYTHEVEKDQKNLIKYYDDHNIFVLPSYTEGHPMALLEALARQRPVIIFKEIQHVIGDKKGIFVAERNSNSFFKTIKHIQENYNGIQQEMKKNKLPTKDEFLKRFSELISKLD